MAHDNMILSKEKQRSQVDHEIIINDPAGPQGVSKCSQSTILSNTCIGRVSLKLMLRKST